ncbi:MAG: class I SAM-dependent methyltransferase [Acidimicrobiales bacterium]|jgi:ubiquinone/menaquinone biosynthesis C-methylase UbiE
MTSDHWFEELADHMGSAYLRYSFTKNTEAEVDFLCETLGLRSGHKVLDVGCGPGRHALELARRGIEVVGVDISQKFLDIAGRASNEEGLTRFTTFRRVDARELASSRVADASFDAAIAMCQGAFGLQAGPAAGADAINVANDLLVLDGMRRAVSPGGYIGVAAFSAYFQVSHLDEGTFDAMRGTHHEVTEIKDEQGTARLADLWTTCFTPRELWLLTERAGLEPEQIHSVYSGEQYTQAEPTVDEPEFFMVARRPESG